MMREVGPCEAAEDLQALATSCDAIVIAVADDAIAPLAADLAQLPLPAVPFVCHLSGGSGTAPCPAWRPSAPGPRRSTRQ
ncbi:hypothetical protein ACFSLT_21385 [Novosphingobium resinovorum]